MPRLLQPTDKWAVVDLETDGLYDEATKVHCIVVRFPDGRAECFHDDPDVTPRAGSVLEGAHLVAFLDRVVMHNGIGFDVPILKKLLGVDVPLDQLLDTIVVSRLLWPEIRQFDFARHKHGDIPGNLIGSHSLEAWGYRLGVLKGSFSKRDDWSTFSQDMLDYCAQDTAVTMALLQHLHSQSLSERSVDLEHRFAATLEAQARNGFAFDVRSASELTAELVGMRAELVQRLSGAFPPFVDHYETPKRKEKKVRTTAFNPLSRPHIARALTDKYGWKPSPVDGHTDAGAVRVDDDVLSALEWPEAKDLGKLFVVTKRLGQLAEGDKSLLSNVRKDGRIPARAIHNGAVTGRCTHKVVVNIPKPTVYLGERFRSLFVAPPGRVLVGVDAKGLELRGLAHFLAPFDGGEYAKVVSEGDPHELNRVAVGLKTRDEAKTFVYALIYGAGEEKLGSIIGGGKEEGARLKKRFMAGIKGYGRLREDIEAKLLSRGMLNASSYRTDIKRGAFLFGLDGRRLYLRGLHSALNTIIQGAGAVLMKAATVRARVLLDEAGLGGVLQVCHQHDEVQYECSSGQSELVSKLASAAFEDCGKSFNFRCPLAADVKVGKNWAETH